MAAYARREAACFGRAMVMPNTVPAISSAAAIEAYRREIETAAGGSFRALMTFKILPGMRGEVVAACVAAGAIAGKYYPAGATTNSSDGLSSPELAEEALGAMESLGTVLSVHAEDPSAPVLEREEAFLPVLESIMLRHPGLKVVFEHISTGAGLDFVTSGPARLAGTLSPHHLLFSIDDMMGEAMDPHLYCKPVIKGKRERDALRRAVFGGNPKLFFGSDSAPHPRSAKECARAASGVYSAPAAIPALVGLFEREGAMEALAGFLAGRGAAFYGLPPPVGVLRLSRRPWTVPAELDGAVPMLSGARLLWIVTA
jgi:dihydroorotase